MESAAPARSGMVIVGAGECGARAALTLRELGYGGAVTLIGAEAHAPYERPPLSKVMLEAGKEPQPRHVASDEQLREAAIDWIASVRATAIDRAAQTVSLSNGETLAYEYLLLATGASPRRL